MVGAITISITYGIRIEDHTDPYIQDVELALKHFATTTNKPGEFMVDIFPIRKSNYQLDTVECHFPTSCICIWV